MTVSENNPDENRTKFHAIIKDYQIIILQENMYQKLYFKINMNKNKPEKSRNKFHVFR